LLVAQEIVGDSAEASQIARLSDGSLAVAAQLVDPALRRLRETLYDGLSQPNFDAAMLAKRMIEGVEEIGGDLQNQRTNAAWIVRFTLEFYRRALLDVARSGGESVSDGIPQAARYVARLDAAPATVDRLQDLFDRAEQTEGHLAARLSVPLSLETLFAELARIERDSAVRS
jgi:DNA polymerase-3 subunit delta'